MSKRPCTGCHTEIKFASECMGRGWRVSFPYDQASPYDVIVEVGGVLKKIQVKKATATIRNRPGRAVEWVCMVGRHTRRKSKIVSKPYKAGDFDVLAVLVGERWFIVPWAAVGALKPTQYQLHFPDENRRWGVGAMDKYEAQWSLLE